MPNTGARTLPRLNHVRKRYGSQLVLDGVELAPRPGEAVGVFGANGSGKSTLLRILAGVTRPSGGTLSGRANTGYVPDRFPAHQRMTARSYLCHMGRIRGIRTRDAEKRADEWLSRLSLANGPRTPMRELSKGNAQKVGLAQALLSRPDLIVLDEPWSGLDVDAREELAEITTELLAEGAGVVFTDHRPEFVRSFATRTYRLAAGKLHPLEADDQVADIVLREPVNEPERRWESHPGVLAVHTGHSGVVVTVRLNERESVLLAAIQHGWRVLSVSTRAQQALGTTAAEQDAR